MAGLRDLFSGELELLEELLAGAQARERDLHVDVGAQTGQRDHLLGEVQDPHGLAHVEDEDLAALAHRAGLEDELRRPPGWS